MHSTHVVTVASIFMPFVAAFTPSFSAPSQCGELRVSWNSWTLEDWPLSDFSLSLIPLDTDPFQKFSPSPLSISVPCGGAQPAADFVVPNLPFPAGTQFFASAHVPGEVSRRQLSNILSVAASSDSSCLSVDRRGRGKGKRQVSVIGESTIDATAVPSSTDANSTSTATGGADVNVVGQTEIPVAEADLAPANNVAPPAPSATPSPSSAAAEDVRVIGVTTMPVEQADLAPVNNAVAPVPTESPAESGAEEVASPTDAANEGYDQYYGGEYDSSSVEANETTEEYGQDEYATQTAAANEGYDQYYGGEYDSSSVEANENTEEYGQYEYATQSAAAEGPECTDKPEEQQVNEQQASEYEYNYEDNSEYEQQQSQSEDSYDYEDNSEYEQQQSQSEDSYDYSQYDDSEAQDQYSEENNYPENEEEEYNYDDRPLVEAGNTEVVHYDSFDDMVNAANSMFKAWNPYRTYGYPPPIATASRY